MFFFLFVWHFLFGSSVCCISCLSHRITSIEGRLERSTGPQPYVEHNAFYHATNPHTHPPLPAPVL
jgi:hypothetical protein